MRYAGAFCLLWLGIKAWRAPANRAGEALPVPTPDRSPSSLYRGGLLVALSNPKLILFARALLPQFIDPARPFLLQLGILVLTFATNDGFWYAVYAQGGRQLSAWLKAPRRERMFNRATGAMFVAFGGHLLAKRA
jgi:threonine/homoserine/homoserine lactone efflux protein